MGILCVLKNIEYKTMCALVYLLLQTFSVDGVIVYCSYAHFDLIDERPIASRIRSMLSMSAPLNSSMLQGEIL